MKHKSRVIGAAVVAAAFALMVVYALPDDGASRNRADGNITENDAQHTVAVEAGNDAAGTDPIPETSPAEDRVDDEDSKAVTLADGRVVLPVWRTMPVPREAVIEAYRNAEALLGLAADGDPFAPFLLYQQVRQCEKVPRSRAALDTDIDRLQQTHISHTMPDGTHVTFDSDEEVAMVINQMGVAFERCQTVRTADIEDPQLLLERAAENGLTTAMIDYANLLDDPNRAFELHRDAWLAGDPHGLLGIHEFHKARFATGQAQESGEVSSAALVAYTALMTQRYREGGFPPAVEVAAEMDAELQAHLQTLLPPDRAAALVAAEQLITNNENCCFE